MEKRRVHMREPLTTNSLLFVSFYWIISITRQYSKCLLNFRDLRIPSAENRALYLGSKLESAWNVVNNRRQKNGRLRKALFNAFSDKIANCVVLMITMNLLIKLFMPFFILKLAEQVESINGEGSMQYFIGLFLISIGAIYLNNQLTYYCFITGTKFQQAITNMICRKALRLSSAFVNREEVEIIKNAIIQDPGRLDVMSWLIHSLWSAPLMFLISGFILFHYIKMAALPGVIFILSMGFCPILFEACFQKFNTLWHETEKRILKTIELITHIEVIKKQAWISYFVETIQDLRSKELRCLHFVLLKHAIHTTLLIFTSRIALFATLIAISLSDHHIHHRDIFLCFYYFDVMAIAVPQLGVRASQQLVEMLHYFKNVEKFMDLEEHPRKHKKDKNMSNSDSECPISLKHVDSSWTRKTHKTQEGQMEMPDAKISADVNNENENENVVEQEGNENPIERSNGSENEISDEDDQKDFSEDFEEFDGEEEKNVEWKSPLLFKNLNLRFKKGLTCIVGPQKCGKTSLLHTLMQQMLITNGSVYSSGVFGFAPQEPWIFSSSIKNNIVFGSTWNEEKYLKVLIETTLLPMLKSFPMGDATVLKDDPSDNSNLILRTLINIARAIYKLTDAYIFDDSFSCLEPARSRYIFEHVLSSKGQLLKDSARILVTNKLQWINQADFVVIMGPNGGIIQTGTPANVNLDELPYLQRKDDTVGCRKMSEINKNFQKKSDGAINTTENLFTSTDDTEDPEAKEVFTEQVAPISIKLKLITRYILEGSGWLQLTCLLIGFLLCYFMSSLADMSFLFWVTFTSAKAHKAIKCLSYMNCTHDIVELSYMNITHNLFFYEVFNVSKDFLDTQTEAKFLNETLPCALNYGIFLLIGLFGTFIINYLLMKICLKTNTQIHNTLLDKLSNASFEFFRKTKNDDITRLIEYDMNIVDKNVPTSLLESINLFFWILSWGIATVYINPYFTIFLILSVILYIITQHEVSGIIIRLKHLDITIKMKMKQYLTKLLNSVTIIRVFKVENSILEDFAHLEDIANASNLANIAAAMGYSFLLELISLFIMFLIFFFALYKHFDIHDMYFMFAFFQLFNYTGMLGWSLKQTTSTLRDLSATERIYKIFNAQQEPVDIERKMRIIRSSWPERAEVRYRNVSLTYPKSKIGIKDISMNFNPRENVGIIGKSGSGKTSFTNALYRIGNIEGCIEIDTYLNDQIPLEKLRSKITTITRTPAVFSGTILSNLDPFEEYPRDDLLDILKIVKLETLNLDMVIEHNGSNLTHQQRHLLAFARSVLPDKRLIIIDDAMSTMDVRTQNIVLNVIKNHLEDRTTFIISNQLQHIIYCQSVLIFENHKIAEFGLPYTLLDNEESKFYNIASSYKKVKPAKLKKMAYHIIKYNRFFDKN